MNDIDREVQIIRLYVSTYWRNLLGDRAPDAARARVLDALERLEAAAKVAR